VDEERSETRYVMRIAEIGESSNFRTHPALSVPLRARPSECRPQFPHFLSISHSKEVDLGLSLLLHCNGVALSVFHTYISSLWCLSLCEYSNSCPYTNKDTTIWRATVCFSFFTESLPPLATSPHRSTSARIHIKMPLCASVQGDPCCGVLSYLQWAGPWDYISLPVLLQIRFDPLQGVLKCEACNCLMSVST